MFLYSAADKLAQFIAEKTNNALKPDEKFKVALKNFLNDLFILHDDPNDMDSQQKTYDALIQQLTDIFTNHNAIGLFASHNPKKSIALACVYAAQITGIRGLLKNKDAFSDTTYFAMYHRHFVKPLPYFPLYDEDEEAAYKKECMSRKDWHVKMVDLLKALGYGKMVSAHHAIPNVNDVTFSSDSIQHIIDKNAYGETAIDIALRYRKPEIVHALLYRMHPNALSLFATRMTALINDSKVFDKHHADKDSFHLFIKAFFQYKLIAISPESLDNIHAWATQNTALVQPEDLANINSWASISPRLANNAPPVEYTIKPRTSSGLIHLKNYKALPEAFQGDLECAPSEMEEVFEILVSILDKLQDPKTRKNFFEDKEFYPTEIPFTPGMLCTLSFQIAACLGGHHAQDETFDMKTFVAGHKGSFKSDISAFVLTKWHFRILSMLEFLKPIHNTIDPFDNKYGKNGKLNTDLLKQWEKGEDVSVFLDDPFSEIDMLNFAQITAPDNKTETDMKSLLGSPMPAATIATYTPLLKSGKSRQSSSATPPESKYRCEIL